MVIKGRNICNASTKAQKSLLSISAHPECLPVHPESLLQRGRNVCQRTTVAGHVEATELVKQKAPIPQLSAEQGANSCSRRSLGGVSLGKPIIGGRTFVAIGANVCCSGGGRSTSIDGARIRVTSKSFHFNSLQTQTSNP